MFFKTKEGKDQILKLYHQKLKHLNIDYSEKVIDTTFGKTNIIITGDTKNTPLFLIHGTGGCAPQILESFPNLSKKYAVYAIDVLAQPNKSAEQRLDMKSKEYGEWITELIVILKLKAVTLVGFSFGGLISLKALEVKASLIKNAFLIAPVYIVNGNPFIGVFKMFMPLKKFIKTKNEKYIKKVLDALFTEYDDFALQFMSTTFLNCNMDFSPLPVISKQSAKQIKTPIYIFAFENDIMFPGKKMKKRAENIFPSLAALNFYKNVKHVPSAKEFLDIENKILEAI